MQFIHTPIGRTLIGFCLGLFFAGLLAALAGCRISTPDSADSGTGFLLEPVYPIGGDCCPKTPVTKK